MITAAVRELFPKWGHRRWRMTSVLVRLFVVHRAGGGAGGMIKAVLIFNNDGKPRLTKFYDEELRVRAHLPCKVVADSNAM